jgi:hypothetical protein
MSNADMRDALVALAFTQATFATWVGVPERTMRHWLNGTSPAPFWLERMLNLMHETGVMGPGDARFRPEPEPEPAPRRVRARVPEPVA